MLGRDIADNGYYGVARDVVRIEKRLDLIKSGILYMLNLEANGWPTIGVNLIDKAAEDVLIVAIGLIEIPLAELLNDHLFLDIESALAESRA